MNAVSTILFAVALFEGILIFMTCMESKRRWRTACNALATTGLVMCLLPSHENEKPIAIPKPEQPQATTVQKVAAAAVPVAVPAKRPDPVAAKPPQAAAVAEKVPMLAPPEVARWIPISTCSSQLVRRGNREYYVTHTTRTEKNTLTGEIRHVASWTE